MLHAPSPSLTHGSGFFGAFVHANEFVNGKMNTNALIDQCKYFYLVNGNMNTNALIDQCEYVL